MKEPVQLPSAPTPGVSKPHRPGWFVLTSLSLVSLVFTLGCIFGLAGVIRDHWGLDPLVSGILSVLIVAAAFGLLITVLKFCDGKRIEEVFALITLGTVCALLGGWFYFLPVRHFTRAREPLTSILLGTSVGITVLGLIIGGGIPWAYASIAIAISALCFFSAWRSSQAAEGWNWDSFGKVHCIAFFVTFFFGCLSAELEGGSSINSLTTASPPPLFHATSRDEYLPPDFVIAGQP